MFSEESSFMNLYNNSYSQEDERSNNILGSLNENFFMNSQINEDDNYPPFTNSIFGNETVEKRETFLPDDISNPSPIPFPTFNLNNFEYEHDTIGDKDLHAKNDKNIQEKVSSSELKKTFYTSKENAQPNSIQMVSKSKKPSKRIDYALKYFKTYFSKFLKEYTNEIIEKSQLPRHLKKQKIFSPNHISYTGNPKESDDYKFLSFSVQEILTYYRAENSKNSLQKKNKKTIEEILNFISECEDDSKYEEVRAFFKMSLEDAYELYYQNEAFKKYAEDEKSIYLDQEFKAQNRFSLLENYGFIKIVKMHGKKK